MTLSTSFPDTFENLPNDIQSHMDDWKEVRQLLTLILSIRSILFCSDRLYKVVIITETNVHTMTYEIVRRISVLNLCKFLSPITSILQLECLNVNLK